jgi:hypothetical protein
MGITTRSNSLTENMDLAVPEQERRHAHRVEPASKIRVQAHPGGHARGNSFPAANRRGFRVPHGRIAGDTEAGYSPCMRIRVVAIGLVMVAATALTGALVAACGSGSPSRFVGTDSGTGCGSGRCPPGDATLDSTNPGLDATGEGPVLTFDANHGAITSIAVTPPTGTLTVTPPSMPPTLALSAAATYADGTTAPVSASWTLDRADIASVGAGSGLVTPTGSTFGVVTVTATAMNVMGTAKITVSLLSSLNPGMLSAAAQASLTAATTADPNVTAFAYPYNATVFPRGLLPPEQMWNGGAAGDSYSIHFTAPSFDLTVFTSADPPSRFTLPTATWNSLTESAAGATVAVELHRLTGPLAYVSAKQTWTIADANLRGTIYYWAINQGQIFQINLTAGTRNPVFDSGPSASLGTPVPANASMPLSPPWEDNGAGKRCVACHSVSKDGSTLTSVFSRAGSSGPLGFVNIASAQITAIGDYQSGGTYDALTPTGSQAVIDFGTKTMQLLDTTSGAPIASTLDGQANLCDPTFSPDGTLFALAASCDPGFGYPVEFRTSNLVVYSYANAAPYFTSPQTILTSAGLGHAIAFPSFSPDSHFLFYQRGDYSRAKYGTNQHGNDDLYVAPVQSGATQIALANANNPGGALPPDSLHLNYAPTVNPIAEGGYIWVVFTSPRDYGNEMVSPQGAPPMDATYANHKQLWVTAVSANIGATDPSNPPFWLPGQDGATSNMFGYWALSPCKPTMGDAGPSTCSAGFECCSGFCRDTGMGPVCVTSPGGCHQVGEACTTSADCCGAGMGVSCIGGICQQTMPMAN